MERIKIFDAKKEYKILGKEVEKKIKQILKEGIFIGGKEVESLEKEVAKFCKTKYAISLNSGTDALFLSLKALEIKPGDEVITTPFTFISTAEVIANLGAKPVFVDINPETFNINVSEIKKAITRKTKAIIPVHLFGQMADMPEIMQIARRYKLKVIEDSAQAFGAEYKLKKAGTFGDLGCFSFFPTKNLGAFGDGGMVITNNKRLAERLYLLRNHGSLPKNKYKNLILGTNSRLDALQAGILRVKLKYLPDWNKKRAETAEYYNKELKGVGDIITPVVAPNRIHIFHHYTIRTRLRDKLQRFLLQKKGIQTNIYYPIPLHLQPAFKYLGYKIGDFPVAERVAKEVLSLPVHPYLTLKEKRFIVKAIKDFYG